ncbi:MAG: phosphoribosylglycinamide formyltransferase [Gammaproteobacteria bacterium]
MAQCNVVILISGSGSNLQALIDQSKTAEYTIASVISNNADAYGLQRATRAGIPTLVIDHRDFADRKEFDLALQEAIDAINPNLLVLAGFMRILGADFVSHFSGRILNIHPSLLPKFQGTRTHERALEAGEKEHGASVHFVTEDLDGGPVIAQERIKVRADDTADSLQRRVLQKEHLLYPKVVKWFAGGRLAMRDGQAWLDNNPLPATGVPAS